MSCSFSHNATSLLLSDVTKPRLTACSQSNSSVQRARPSGGSTQAKAIICCCCLGVNVGGAPDRGASYNARATSSVQKFLRTLRTVRSEQPTCSAISSSVNPSSDFSRIVALRTTRTDRVPNCTNSCKLCRAPSLRRSRKRRAGLVAAMNAAQKAGKGETTVRRDDPMTSSLARAWCCALSGPCLRRQVKRS